MDVRPDIDVYLELEDVIDVLLVQCPIFTAEINNGIYHGMNHAEALNIHISNCSTCVKGYVLNINDEKNELGIVIALLRKELTK